MPKFILELSLEGYANAFTISSQLQRISNKMWSDGKATGDVHDINGNTVGHYEVR